MPRLMGVRVLISSTGLAALLLVGCGQAGSGVLSAGEPGALGRPGGGEEPMVECGRSVYEAGALEGAPPASSLSDGPAGAVDDLGNPAFDTSLGWSVVHSDDERVDLVRELDVPVDNGGGDVRRHEAITLERITGASNVPDGTWLLSSAGPCEQRLVDRDGLRAADITLAHEPAPDTRTVHLLVRERACASGGDAEGRIVVDLRETADEVRLRIGVRPEAGAQDCQGHPATPHTVELGEPLGARQVVDASVVPPRPVVVAESD